MKILNPRLLAQIRGIKGRISPPYFEISYVDGMSYSGENIAIHRPHLVNQLDYAIAHTFP